MKNIFNITPRRWFGLIAGNVLIGIGVGIFKLSGTGNDPFSAMVMSLNDLMQIKYATLLILINIGIFLVELAFGRKFIGAGTFVNWFLLGYVVEFTIWLGKTIGLEPGNLVFQLIYVLAGVILISLGLSFYQTSDAGISPYDSMAVILDERIPKLSYFWCRMICDGICVLVCLVAGGLIGLGTFVCAFGLGPVAHFFNVKLSRRLIMKES